MALEIEKSVRDLAQHLMEEIHGSGIDADWKEVHKKNHVVIRNSFHCLNKNGMHGGWQDFSVLLPLNGAVSDFKLIFHAPAYLAAKHQLKDYLEDLLVTEIDQWLNNYKDAHGLVVEYYSGHINKYLCLSPKETISILLKKIPSEHEYQVKSFEIIYPE